MGKDTGFLEYSRKEPGYRPKAERLKDFKAVDIEPDEEDIYEQAARCMDCGIPFCHGYGCPVSNIIPEFNDLVYRGQWQEALDILCSTNNFPEFTGRLCPATCETACVAGINTDPVTIRQIELAVIEKLLCTEIEWVQDTSGATVPKEKPGAEFQIDADLVILAMGFVGPGNNTLIENFQLTLDNRGHVKADQNMMTNVDGIFVAGDMTTGQSLIVRAIASGRKAAQSIVAYFAATDAPRPESSIIKAARDNIN